MSSLPGSTDERVYLSVVTQRRFSWLIPSLFVAWVSISILLGIDRPLRYGFPVVALLVSAYLVRVSPGMYLSFTLWVWFLTPFIRRMVDFSAGWVDPSVTLLAPYLVTSVCVFPLAARLLEPSKQNGTRPGRIFAPAFLLSLAGIALGVIPGVIHYSLAAVISEGLNWSIPILFAWYLAVHSEHWPEFRDACLRTFRWALVVVGAYGIYQFAVAPEWDRSWMVNIEATAMGQPLPFQIRVFSTMNGSAVMALALAAGLVLWIASPTRWGALGGVLSSIALLLSQVRTAWIALVLGIALLMRFKKADRNRSLLTIAVLIVVASGVLLAVGNRDSILEDLSKRAKTVGSLSHDESADDRLNAYKATFSRLREHPLGYGLGAPDTMLSTPQIDISLKDNVVSAAILQLGLLGALLYFAGIAGMFGKLVLFWLRPRSKTTLAMASVGIAMVSVLYLASTVVGPTGVLAWMFFGLLLCENCDLSGAPPKAFDA